MNSLQVLYDTTVLNCLCKSTLPNNLQTSSNLLQSPQQHKKKDSSLKFKIYFPFVHSVKHRNWSSNIKSILLWFSSYREPSWIREPNTELWRPVCYTLCLFPWITHLDFGSVTDSTVCTLCQKNITNNTPFPSYSEDTLQSVSGIWIARN